MIGADNHLLIDQATVDEVIRYIQENFFNSNFIEENEESIEIFFCIFNENFILATNVNSLELYRKIFAIENLYKSLEESRFVILLTIFFLLKYEIILN